MSIAYIIEFKTTAGSNWRKLDGLEFNSLSQCQRAWFDLIKHGKYHAYRTVKRKRKKQLRISTGPKLKPDSVKSIMLAQVIEKHEREYKAIPVQDLPSLKLHDYQDYTDWKKLPTLKTV